MSQQCWKINKLLISRMLKKLSHFNMQHCNVSATLFQLSVLYGKFYFSASTWKIKYYLSCYLIRIFRPVLCNFEECRIFIWSIMRWRKTYTILCFFTVFRTLRQHKVSSEFFSRFKKLTSIKSYLALKSIFLTLVGRGQFQITTQR